MISRIDSVNNFVNSMLNTGSELSTGLLEYENNQNAVKKIVHEVESNFNKILSEMNSDDTELNNMKKGIVDSIKEILSENTRNIEESAKSAGFIKAYEKTFVVSVFGKVKSGKSSLGNFIIGHDIKETKINTEYDNINPKITVYDKGKVTTATQLATIEEENDRFGVGTIETTSTIQSFTIGGMTWFDTPGIGSITKENEELAQEYIKNSDLVIFTVSSDAAGTTQEWDELKKLCAMEKPLLLLITMSDSVEEDCNDDGVLIQIPIPKSPEDRKAVENYLNDQIDRLGLVDIRKYSQILTVSKNLAVESFKREDDELYDQSNLGVFLEKLISITKNDAAQIKLKTPAKRLNNMINSMVNRDIESKSFYALRDKIYQTRKNLEENSEKIRTEGKRLSTKIRSTARNKIDALITRYTSDIKNGNSSFTSDQLSGSIIQIISETSEKICAEELTKYMNDTSQDILKTMNQGSLSIPSLEMKKDSVSYDVQRVRRVRRSPHGLIEKVKSFFLNTEYYSNETYTETMYKSFDLGVNDGEVRNSVNSQLSEYIEAYVQPTISDIVDNYFAPSIEMCDKLLKVINDACLKLEKLKISK